MFKVYFQPQVPLDLRTSYALVNMATVDTWAHSLLTRYAHFANFNGIPWGTYCDPEASCGGFVTVAFEVQSLHNARAIAAALDAVLPAATDPDLLYCEPTHNCVIENPASDLIKV